MTIPADNFQLTDDGYAWITFPGGRPLTDDGSFWSLLNRQCDICDGDGTLISIGTASERYLGRLIPANERVPCPDCNGTGRHTFVIEVECTGSLVENISNGRFGLSCDGGCGKAYPWGVLTYRVSVVEGMVLPIVSVLEPVTDENCERDEIVIGQDGRTWWKGSPITLPPAAKPGMFAVKLAVPHVLHVAQARTEANGDPQVEIIEVDL